MTDTEDNESITESNSDVEVENTQKFNISDEVEGTQNVIEKVEEAKDENDGISPKRVCRKRRNSSASTE